MVDFFFFLQLEPESTVLVLSYLDKLSDLMILSHEWKIYFFFNN